jgi:hypothetical protein
VRSFLLNPSGGLHEETGAGYVAKHGGLVYRKTLNPKFTLKNAMSIIDEQVKTKVLEQLESMMTMIGAFFFIKSPLMTHFAHNKTFSNINITTELA